MKTNVRLSCRFCTGNVGFASTNEAAVHFPVPWYVGVHCSHPVAKHNDSHDGGWYQELSVNTEPCEVQTDLLTKVLPVGSEVRDQEVEVTDMMTEQDGGELSCCAKNKTPK